MDTDKPKDNQALDGSFLQKDVVAQEIAKVVGRYGLEVFLEALIEVTSPSSLGNGRVEVADLQSRLVVALSTYRKSYENRQKN